MNRTVVIVGGGLAGIAAATRLLGDDWRPVILETSKRLGGRATSYDDARSGSVVDNCQHVVLGCCTNVLDLYERLGVLDLIEWHRTLYWTAGRGTVDTLTAAPLPAPLHMAPSFGRMSILDAGQRRAIRRCMWRMIRMGRNGRLAWTDRTMQEFLEACDQPDAVIRRFWEPIIVSACNLSVADVCAAHALQVFQDGFLANRWSYTMGLATVPLARLYDPADALIREHGGEIRLGTAVRGIAYDGSRVSGVVTGDGMIEATAVIAAVPFHRLDKLVSDTMRRADTRLQRLDRLGYSSILGVHLWFDTEVMELPHLVLVDHGVQWIFNKGVDEAGRQHLHAVISAADEWMGLTEERIIARVVHDVHHALPGAVGIEPVEARAIKEKRATFAATPGIDALRPRAAPGCVGLDGGGIRNLYLAGDWTDTGWPATMEGAVRSGYAAAAAITGDDDPIVDDVPAGLLARALGLR